MSAIELGASLMIAVATVSIPLVLDRNARAARTMDVLDEVDKYISEAVLKKIVLDTKNNKKKSAVYDPAYIDAEGNSDVQNLVYGILNKYAYLCTGANMDIFSSDTIKRLRSHALDQTWKDYRRYIDNYRRSGEDREDAWAECDDWLAKNLVDD